ncbi:MAG: heme exporter protein CcmD [Alphaproteobacteria bacterium]|nr:heme exporter protein CcmD [Alphaproteobacteria bacterium]
MGGHAFFVWGSYAVAVVLLGGLTVWSLADRRRLRREIEARGLERRR